MGSLLLRKLLFPKHCNSVEELGRKAKGFAMKRAAHGKEHHVDDIFTALMGQGEKGPVLSMDELGAEGAVMIGAGMKRMRIHDAHMIRNTLIPAGTDTSSVAISSLFFYLSRHPAAYERLASEIRTIFRSAEEIAPGPKLTSCGYLRTCIDESLRLAPPIAAPLWREMCRHGDAVAGIVLPKGTDVATCIYSIQRNPAYFSDPNEFKPERWLSEYENESWMQLAKKAFVPFSLGSRGCIGKNLAYQEISTALAQIIYRMDWKIADGPLGKIGETRPGKGGAVDFDIRGHYTSAKTGPFIQFMPRDSGNTKSS